ncbi:mechanosensitive ion channel domain-containing protein [Gilvibacter sediminis]|uniref:mechanosensitive ion channel domain-containing protein n=1 Tax=Gilvibacter sediminis TaxID=379071 RepID=UPI002350388A|nr:mechanosensitive ion channel family protein [Gilvibacter sediminis]MDC7996434.1 mechanosensitive ion channel family protein [Gilvibacter sediminis]
MLTHQLIWTAIVLVAMFIAIVLGRLFLRRFSVLRNLDGNRRKVVLNLHYILVYSLAAIVLAVVWGLKLEDFTVFISSILAVLGVGFFAQWSILSNLTASVILFFNHPVRIGHRIKVIDKDYNWTGVVTDITGFYLYMTTDSGEYLTLPNNLVLQKGIELLPEHPIEEPDNQEDAALLE